MLAVSEVAMVQLGNMIIRQCLKKNLNASTLDLLSIPQSGREMSKRLGEIIGCIIACCPGGSVGNLEAF